MKQHNTLKKISLLILIGALYTNTFGQTKDSINLDEVTISTNKKVEEMKSLNKIDVDLKDLPVTIHSIDKKLIDQRGGIALEDAMKNVTGVRSRNTYGGFQHFHIRGMEQFVLLVDGVRDERHNISQSAPSTNLAAVEGIDVLKGPSSVLFGHSALGGIINIRRKQPTSIFKADFMASYSSYNTRNISAGAGGAINSKLSFRTDFGVGQSQGFRNFGNSYTNGYFALKYVPHKKHTIQISVQANDDFYATDTGLPVEQDGSLVKGMNPLTRYNDPQDYLKNKRVDMQLKYHYLISENWGISNTASYFFDDINYFSTEELTLNATKDSLTRSFPFYFNHQTKPFQNQLDLNGTYKIGKIENKFVLGYSFNMLDRKTYRGVISGAGKNAKISVANPVLNQGAMSIEDNRYQARMETSHGIFAQNWINISEKLKALVAVRVDIFNGDYYTNTVDKDRNVTVKGTVSKLNITNPTYRAGLVYEPIKNLSIYSSYNTYFKPTRTVAADGTMFDPETGYQGELGVRYAYKEFISINVSAFTLARTNILQSFAGGVFKNIGTGTSKGFEVDLQANITSQFCITAGYSNANTRVEKNNDDNFENPNVGKKLAFAPEHLVHSWLTYELDKSILKGLGIGAGASYTSENYTDASNTYKLPSYTLIDAAIWYKFSKYELRFNVNNITDQFYYRDAIFANQFFVGMNRNFMLTFKAAF
jgi:iron complex outermembrane receptor protein